MTDFFKELFKHHHLFLLIIGIALFIVAVNNGFTFNALHLTLTEPFSRISLGVLAVILIAIGLFPIVREQVISARSNVCIETTDCHSNNVLLNKFPDTFRSEIEKASEIWMVGVSMNTTLRDFYSMLKKKVENGDSIKILLRDPEHGVESIVNHSYMSVPSASIKDRIELSLGWICKLKAIAPNNVDVKVLDHHYSLGLFALDMNGSNGKIYVEYYPYKLSDRDLPKLIITPEHDFWYDFYKSQLKALWDNGKTWTCNIE